MDPGPKPPQEERRFDAGGTLVDMRFIQNNVTQARAGKHSIVFRTQHHIFQHGVVCYQNMRRSLLHHLAGDELILRGIYRVSR